MLEKVKQRIKQMFGSRTNSYGTALEAYIVSKNPKNASDVEFFTQEFDRKMAESIWSFGGRYGR